MGRERMRENASDNIHEIGWENALRASTDFTRPPKKNYSYCVSSKNAFDSPIVRFRAFLCYSDYIALLEGQISGLLE